MSDSLVRVSRRAEWGAHRPVPGARRYIAETARAANHDRRDGISTSPIDSSGFGRRTNPQPVHAPSRSADRLIAVHIRPGRLAGPHSLPSRQFQALFDSLFKVLFIFPSLVLVCYRSHAGYLALDGIYRPIGAAFPNNPTRQTALRVVPPDLGSRSKHRLKTTHWGSSSRASLTAHDARHNTRVFSTTTSRASTEGDSSLGQPHHKHGRPISAPNAMCPIRDAWLGRRDA
ncbi:hypothetical protein L2E82_50670 [Cichorium intybus]|nr:hypothetical protein L2E82_50670 [Cichorium intybus]